jgi:hypothetical protein
MRYKPHFVKPLDINRHRQTCLCQECTDMRLQLESVSKHRAAVVSSALHGLALACMICYHTCPLLCCCCCCCCCCVSLIHSQVLE